MRCAENKNAFVICFFSSLLERPHDQRATGDE
jgi:hypothetical protein